MISYELAMLGLLAIGSAVVLLKGRSGHEIVESVKPDLLWLTDFGRGPIAADVVLYDRAVRAALEQSWVDTVNSGEEWS